MTLTEIQNLNLVDIIDEVLMSLYDSRELPSGEQLYTIDPDITMPLYSRIKLNPAYKLADISVLQDEKDKIKERMVKDESERLEKELVDIKNAKKKSLEDRVKKIKNYHSAALSIGKYYPNREAELNRIVEEMDEVTLKELEDQDIIEESKNLKLQTVYDKKIIGHKKKMVCDECLDIIRGDNNLKSDMEIDGMKVKFADIYEYLKDGSPSRAKALILKIPYDTTIDELKNELLEELSLGGF